MQTFLPYADFQKSAEVLDYRRLGKQRLECMQIHRAIIDPNYGWQNHPAVRMWREYDDALCCYYFEIFREWHRRGYRNGDNLRAFFDYACIVKNRSPKMPIWFGREDFHYSHQSNLVRKNPSFYRRYFPDVPDNLEYIWP